MKPAALLLWFCCTGPLVLGATPNGFEVRGVYQEGARTVCSILDLKSGQSAWVEVGQRFRDHQLIGFDTPKAVATLLAPGGERVEVGLSAAPIRRVQPSEVLSREAAKAELMGRFARLGESRPATPAEIAALGQPPAGSKRLSELGDAEFNATLRALVQAQQMPSSAAAMGAPAGWVPLRREVLPIELSFNLTDADLEEINDQMRRQFDAQLGPMLKKIADEIRRSVVAPRS